MQLTQYKIDLLCVISSEFTGLCNHSHSLVSEHFCRTQSFPSHQQLSPASSWAPGVCVHKSAFYEHSWNPTVHSPPCPASPSIILLGLILVTSVRTSFLSCRIVFCGVDGLHLANSIPQLMGIWTLSSVGLLCRYCYEHSYTRCVDMSSFPLGRFLRVETLGHIVSSCLIF